MMDEHDISHRELHDKLEHVETLFNEKHSTLIKWIASAILTIMAMTMTRIVSVASTLSGLSTANTMMQKSIHKVEEAQVAVQQRIQEESREAEDDLKEHRKEQH